MNSGRNIAMTDIETSGDIPGLHEILEIGLVVFNPTTFEIIDKYESKVKPKNIKNAVQAALNYNGYNEELWENATELEGVMKIYGDKTKDCVFMSYNISFDWSFINQAFYESKVLNPMSTLENHDRLDLLTLAWALGLNKENKWSLKNACNFFGISPESEPHSALNGAMTAYELFKKIEEGKR